MNNSISEFEKKIGYDFKDKELITQALTHSSFCAGRKDKALYNNERLEFLGDAFFDAIISEELYERIPGVEEGTLTKVRAKIVCEQSLYECGHALNIGEYMRMGKGEDKSGGRQRMSITADAVEAVIGALVLDGGYDAAKRFVLDKFAGIVDSALSGKLNTDYKSEIQEKVQGMSHEHLTYIVTDEQGPDHEKVFFVELLLGDRVIGHGRGRSKKEAERNAAKEALERGDTLVF